MVFDDLVPFDPPPPKPKSTIEIPNIGSNLMVNAVVEGVIITYSRARIQADNVLLEPLAYFSLGALEAQASLSNGFMDINADISLSHIFLKDERPYDAIATDSMQRKVLETNPTEPFLKAAVELKLASTDGPAPPRILSVTSKAKFGGLTAVICDFLVEVVDSIVLTPFEGLPPHVQALVRLTWFRLILFFRLTDVYHAHFRSFSFFVRMHVNTTVI